MPPSLEPRLEPMGRCGLLVPADVAAGLGLGVQVSSGAVKFKPPRADVNAPDLYIPLSALWTYVLLVCVVQAGHHTFKPDNVYATVRACAPPCSCGREWPWRSVCAYVRRAQPLCCPCLPQSNALKAPAILPASRLAIHGLHVHV